VRCVSGADEVSGHHLFTELRLHQLGRLVLELSQIYSELDEATLLTDSHEFKATLVSHSRVNEDLVLRPVAMSSEIITLH
jgi:hypothetical protein